MPSWLSDPRAPFIIAAYALAALGLGGLLIGSLIAAYRVKQNWQNIVNKRAPDDTRS